MITNKYQEIFDVLYGYITENSQYEPLVTKKAPLQPTKFPVVEVKARELPLNTTTRDEEVINQIVVTINIYAIEKTIGNRKVSSIQITDELTGLIEEAMKDMLFRLTRNDEVENLDQNVYRVLLQYKAGVNTATNKIIRRF